MKFDSLGHDLQGALNSAEQWIRLAEQQWMVADAVAPELLQRRQAPTEAGSLLRVGYLRAIGLQLALSTENALKAVKASRAEFAVDSKGMMRKSRGGGSSGHGLLQLAAEIDFPLTASEKSLLALFTEVGIWAGKYHAPLTHDAFERANAATPVSIRLPHDLDVVKSIIRRAAAIANVNMVMA